MNKLDKEIVVSTWFFSGLEDLFFAFQIGSHIRYQSFLNTMGFEKICKAYLLAENSFEYENLERREAKKKINSLAICWRHNLEYMINKISKSVNNQELENLTNQDFDGYTGKQIIKTMEAAYLECRYPVPKYIHEEFPINGKPDKYQDPIASSGIEKFCWAFTRKIIIYLKKRFDISIPKDEFSRIITGKDGERFCNLFLQDVPEGFLN